MASKQDVLFLIAGLAAWIAGLIAILRLNRHLAKRASSPIEGDPPLYLPGFWPLTVQRRYQEMDVEGRRRFWKHLNWTTTWLAVPLVVALVISALVLHAPIPIVVSIAAMVAAAIWYSMSGK
jgi:hypothetical protein